MGSSTKTTAAMATDKNSNGFNFGTTTNAGGSFGNRFEGQRFAGATTGVVASFQKQVPDFLRTDPDVVRMVAALNREENNFNRIYNSSPLRDVICRCPGFLLRKACNITNPLATRVDGTGD